MATGNVTVTTAAAMIPEVWLPQVDIALQRKLKFLELCRKVGDGNGKLGDKVHVPKINYAAARDKAANTEYTFDVTTDTDMYITIDKHKYEAIRIEGIVKVQSNVEQVAARVQQVVYPVAKALDADIAALHSGITASVDAGAMSTSTAVDKILELWQTLADADAPEDGRYLVCAPAVAAVLMKTAGFISKDYRTTEVVSTGVIGSLYGFDIIISNATEQSGGDYINIAGVKGVTLGIALAKDVEIRVWDEPRHGHDTVGMSAEAIYGVAVCEAAAGCKFLVDVAAE